MILIFITLELRKKSKQSNIDYETNLKYCEGNYGQFNINYI